MTTTHAGDGKGVVGFDAKVGLFVNGLVTAAGLALVEFLGTLDFSTLPAFVATLAPVVVGMAANWITTRFLPRYSAGAARR